jgi:hypothetical protein
MTQSELSWHPIRAAVAVVDRALARVADCDPLFMSTEDKRAALLETSTAIDRMTELQARLLANADDVAAQDGARDAAAWLAHHGRRDRGECRRRLRLGRDLARHPQVAGALRAGEMNPAQAEVVARAVDALPAGIDDGVRAAAEERLVVEAARFGPRKLRILGRRVLDVVAPEVAEAIEGRLLAQEEARASDNVFVRRRRRGDGTSDLHIRGTDATVDRLLAYLHAFTSPRREGQGAEEGAGPVEDRRPYAQRLGAAFAAFLEAIDPKRLPLHGGDATTVIVTVGLDQLRQDLGVACIGDEPITAAEARRLACTASILPAVLDGTSNVLDLGRAQRLFSRAQRKALAIRYPVCAADGCDIPAAWCEAHHAGDPWARGGRTDLADGVLLCSFHHHRAHDHRYRTDRMPDGGVRFTRRT